MSGRLPDTSYTAKVCLIYVGELDGEIIFSREDGTMYRAKNGKRTSMLRVLVCLLALLSFVASSQSGFAQSSNGQITGLVTDSSGAAIDGATVSATNTATGVAYNGTTNGAGVYVLAQLIPGPYKVSMAKQGFATVERRELTVRTGDHLSLDFTLSPATTKEVITVTESTPLLQSDQTSQSTVLDNKMITELPQLNRNSLDLTGVIPQIQGKGPQMDNIASLGTNTYLIANTGNSYAVSGGQVNGTSISVDGNQLQDSEFNAVNRAIPTPDSIGEFRVESGVLTADRWPLLRRCHNDEYQERHEPVPRAALRVFPQPASEQQWLAE